jgi:hypothetical protein
MKIIAARIGFLKVHTLLCKGKVIVSDYNGITERRIANGIMNVGFSHERQEGKYWLTGYKY